MPPLPSVPGVVKIIVNGLTGAAIDRIWNNVFHAQYGGTPPSETQLNGIAGNLYNAWIDTGILSQQTVDTTLESVEVVDLSSDMGASGFAALGPSTGTNGEDPLPAQVCTLISYEQDLRYRGGHPRSYLNAGGDGNLLTMNQWNPGYLSAMEDAFDVWWDAWGSTSSGGFSLSQQCSVSYVNKEINPTPPYRRTTPVVLPLLNFSVDQLIATQRRRVGRKATA